eukprot:TRINITY_DN462_c0_g1_i3.p1 TRINITY_DN462_c0_g1~~TRINITY_DN462_c0_g1_i3.p1  ORF type:complete len:212 (+),score=61.17 TRINITY_DN462_c0_g1_i3:179-814(+)
MPFEKLPSGERVHCDGQVEVVMLGKSNAGKSTLVVRYVEGDWDPWGIGSGCDSRLQKLRRSGEVIWLHLHDFPGQAQHHTVARRVCQKTDAAVVVYDVTDRSSFDSIPDWVSFARPGAPVMILANKVDMMARRVVSAEEGRRMAERFGATHAEVSAKCGDGVNGAFESIVSAALERGRKRRTSAGPAVRPQSLLSRFVNLFRWRPARTGES